MSKPILDLDPNDLHNRACHVLIDYTNWRGERAVREVVPERWGFHANPWHPQEQWMMYARDVAKGEYRWFAMSGIHSWQKK